MSIVDTPTNTNNVDMRIREEFVSVQAMLNPYADKDSSPRGAMVGGQFGQLLTFFGTEPKVNPTGIEKQFIKNTFKIETEEDFLVTSIVIRNPEVGTISDYPNITVIGEYLGSKRIEALVIPTHFSLTQLYGFKYKRNTQVLKHLRIGEIIPKGTILADSPNVKDGTYCYGINANLALITDHAGGQDGVIVNKDLLPKLRHRIYQERTITCSLDEIILNTHGDDELYKIVPDIGDHIGEMNIAGATRKMDYSIAPALTGKSTLDDIDPDFDKCQFVKPGKILDTHEGTRVVNNTVVDVIIHKSPKTKHRECIVEPPQLNKYVQAGKKYHEGLIRAYDEKCIQNRSMGVMETRCTPNFQNMLVNAYGRVNKDNEKIVYKFKNEPLDLYYITIVTEYIIEPTIGYKLTDAHGSKGMVVEVRDPEKMPVDKWGNVADVIMDPTSISSRMNVGRLYEIYFGASSRQMKRRVTDFCKANDMNIVTNVDEIFTVIVKYLKMIGEDQGSIYESNATHGRKLEVLKEIIDKEFYVKMTISNRKGHMNVVSELEESEFKLEETQLFIDGQITDTNIFMGPIYLMLLNKSSDNYLATASSLNNHYNLPVRRSVADKHTIPYSDNPPRILSETELRFIANNANSPILAAELKDRASSADTHKHMYRRLLQLEKPTDIDVLVDRKEYPYGNDEARIIIKNVFSSLGVDLTDEL